MKKNISEHQIYHCLDSFPIFRFSISGGPCAGKTTLIEKIKIQFTNKGFNVISLPEIPTLVYKAGVSINTSNMELEEKLSIQTGILRLKIFLEDEFHKMVQHSDQPTIILSDRGTMDSCAYVSKQEFNTILDQQGWSIANLRDKRYDAVIFLTTAADGAEQFYSLANNQARSEGLNLSRELDLKTLEAWIGHPNLVVIENVKGQSFETKMRKATESIEKSIGIQAKRSEEKKFLISQINIPNDIQVWTFDVQQIFLTHPEKVLQDKIRKRGQKGSYTYQRRFRVNGKAPGQVSTIKIALKPIQYLSLVKSRCSPNHLPLKKQRLTFLYKKQVFVVDKIFLPDPITVFKYNQKEGSTITIPDFVKVQQDITHNQSYKSEILARKKAV